MQRLTKMSHAETKKYLASSADKERQELVVNNLPFVRHVLGKIVGRLPSNVDAENLESAGILGLVEASHQFQSERGVAFRTFAYPRVWGAIIDELRRNSPLPQKLMNQITQVKKAQERLEPPITAERLALLCDLSIEEVDACLQAMRISSPSPLCEKTLSVLFSNNSPSVSADMEMEEAKQKLADHIQDLPEQQRLVLTMYYSEDLRLKEIGRVFNLSESRISRILSAAEKRLRNSLGE